MNVVEFTHFSCYYKRKNELTKALDDLSFSIAEGELFVVVGESGCGKTTLLKSVMGLSEYLEGELTVDGISVDSLDVRHSNIGYVSQEAALYPHLTVYENIAFPLRSMHTAQEEVDRRVKDIAQILDVTWLLTRKPRQLSWGQRQRIAIARALIKNPSILLLDEPFSNADPKLRTELRCLLRSIHQQLQTTMLFVTHDLGEAFSLADRMLVLEQGHTADIGSPAELLQNHRSALLEDYLK